MTNKTDAPILIIGAMDSETDILRRAMTDVTEYRRGNMRFIEGCIGGKATVICVCLIGMVYSAAATALALERYSPRLVINCGTAGGHSPRVHQGDMVLGERIINAGRFNTPHRDRGRGSDFTVWQYPERERFEEGGYEYSYSARSSPDLISAAAEAEYSHGAVYTGTLLSSDGWNREIDRILHFNSAMGSLGEDMESFSVAKICEQFDVPCLIARIISNNELYPEEQCDFELYGRHCQSYILSLVERL